MIVNVYRWLFGKRVTVVPPEWAPTGDPYSVPCLTPFEKINLYRSSTHARFISFALFFSPKKTYVLSVWEARV